MIRVARALKTVRFERMLLSRWGLAFASLGRMAIPNASRAQDPIRSYSGAFEARFDRSQPVVRYTITVRPHADSTGYRVAMRIGNVRDTIRLAIPLWAPGAYRVAAFHRYIKNIRATTVEGTSLDVVRDDSSTWRVVAPRMKSDQTVDVTYEVRYPTPQAAAGMGNYSFFRPDGALLSGAMTYLYIVGQTLAPAHVTFDLPDGWRAASGLIPTASDARTFFAPTYDVLIDCPVLIGASLRIWPFEVDGIPHRIAYYMTTPHVSFDSLAFVRMHQQVVEASRDIMGRLPYREYTFIYEDGPGGGLEHLNSATMSAPSAALVRDPRATAGLTAHEFFHAWNVKRIRPRELGPFAYDRPVRVSTLWWAEGMTDFFASEITRRTGLFNETQAVAELAGSIEQYLQNPGRMRISPERASMTAWDPNTVNGGYNVSYYLTGTLLGEMLELSIRYSTNGARGIDDVERLLFDRYAADSGYTAANLLAAVNEIAGYDMRAFFDAYVSGTAEFDFAPYLALAGWQTRVTRAAADSNGVPFPDVRASITSFNGVGSLGSYVGSPARLALANPNGSFGRAGLVDGDFITSVDGKTITTPQEFRAAFAGAKVGNTYQIAYVRAGRARETTVTILPLERVSVQVVDLPTVTPAQRRIRSIWLHGPGSTVRP